MKKIPKSIFYLFIHMTFQLMDGNLGGEEEEDYDERRRKRPSLLGEPGFISPNPQSH